MPTAVMKFAYRHRGILVAIPLVIAIVNTWHEYENEVAAWAWGGALFTIGLVLRIWAQQHLHYRLKAKTNLTLTGPYIFVRNPIYVGNTLICLALTVASEVLWLLPVTLLTCCIIYSLAVRYEEQKLIKQYGDEYIAFQHAVPRWIPRWRNGLKPRWTRDYLLPSILVEAYNLLFIIPVILKEVLSKHV